MGDLYAGDFVDPISNINQILGQVSGNAAVARHRLDLSYIGDPNDREFLRTVIDALLALEPGNTDLVVLKNTDHPIWIVWAQGLRRPVGDGQTTILWQLPHPIPSHKGIGNVQVYPPKGMQPMRLVCEVNPHAPIRAREEQRRLLESNHRYQSQHPSRSHYERPALTHHEDHYHHSRNRDRSPVRRSPSPVVRHHSPIPRRSSRRKPAQSYSASSSGSGSSDSENEGSSLWSTLNPFHTRHRRRN